MTYEQEMHLGRIKSAFEAKVNIKYRKGQLEHGGDLVKMNALNLIDAAIDEAIDQIVYLETLREIIVGEE